MKPGTVEDYHRRLGLVLVHIQGHLDDDLSLDELAKLAGFSAFHFHRIFHGMSGETLKEHVRRLRLERAAHQLRHTSLCVTEVAFRAGYESHESFTRAFGRIFERSPKAFRQARRVATTAKLRALVHYSPSGDIGAFRPLRPPSRIRGASVPLRFERLPTMRVAFVRHVGAYSGVDLAIRQLIRWASPMGLLTEDASIFGIAHDDTETTPSGKLRFDAALRVSESVTPTAPGVSVQILPARSYAVAQHCGPYETLGRTYSLLCGEWLPSSGDLALAAPALEFYLNSPHDTPRARLRTDIYLPIAA